MKFLIKTALSLLAVGLLAGCVYTPYPSGYYYPTYSSTYPTYTRCYNYNSYPYTRCYYSSSPSYYYNDSWAW